MKIIEATIAALLITTTIASADGTSFEQADSDNLIDFALVGNNSNWLLKQDSEQSSMIVDISGNFTNGTLIQTGNSTLLNYTLVKTGTSVFTTTVNQSGNASTADVNIHAEDVGEFTLTQSGTGSSFTGDLFISAGGTVTVTQQ